MAPTDHAPGKLPEHEATYRRLRDMVMFGELEPGQKVTIQGITATLGAGMTPVREAIRRLTAEGALILHENRRVSVPRLTPSQVEELAFARLALEPRLAALAMERLTPAGIDRIESLDQALDVAIAAGETRGYLAGNYRFHFALYDVAGAPILTSLTQSLWLRFAPSLRVVMTSDGAIGPDLHKEALSAMRAGDGRALVSAIEGDIRQGIDRVRADLHQALLRAGRGALPPSA
ncbi:MAG TPA: GntR family transcriptional regulator [Pararhodobacter sp.]|uniref:GntR family transcriptional regulator n=1 Tax=Pararhodobacter sp. TaxID=2127056 RepID=UPI002BAF0A54|nr:GntR family transcriptional regulator [Pararhodobacter sp.]HPD91083.1 GntR family transcriptional regulator [Pararhodobacter sp.]